MNNFNNPHYQPPQGAPFPTAVDRKNKKLRVWLIAVCILLPVMFFAGLFSGIKLDATVSDNSLKYMPKGYKNYSDCIEDEWCGFQSAIGYYEYRYDESFDSDFKNNGYYHTVTDEDIAEICSFITEFEKARSTHNESFSKDAIHCNLDTAAVDTQDYYFIEFSDRYRKFDFYYVYFYDTQSHTLFELWYDE